MRSQLGYAADLSVGLLAGVVSGQNTTADMRMNVTALASRDGYSVIECWQLAATGVYARSATNFIASGDLTQAMYSIIEPRTTPGEAWAPGLQLTAILNGLIRISTPSAPPPLNDTVAYIMPGTLASSLVIAADVRETSSLAGHYTEFPSDEQTVLLQLPFADNVAQDHTVLYDGPCRS